MTAINSDHQRGAYSPDFFRKAEMLSPITFLPVAPGYKKKHALDWNLKKL